MDYVKIYTTMAVSFLVIDSVWLGLIAKNFYKKYIGYIMATNPNLRAAGLFYAIYLFGLMVLVVLPAARAQLFVQALWGGALFGLVCYATYDLTSQAVIKDWPTTVTVVDLLWGTFITTTVAAVGYWIASGLSI